MGVKKEVKEPAFVEGRIVNRAVPQTFIGIPTGNMENPRVRTA